MPAMLDFPPSHTHTSYADGFMVENAAPRPQGPKAFAISTNKTLTSKFRGVCWNKKNKRWQAAINSNGRYLYLGSYDTQEEAARIFDKAAVRVRGPKARINFIATGYFDSLGNVLPDAQIESLLLTACNPTKQRRHRNKDGELVSHPTDQTATTSANQVKAFADIALQALARFAGSTQEKESIVLPTTTTGLGISYSLPAPPALQLSASQPTPFMLSHRLASGLAAQASGQHQAVQARQTAVQWQTSSASHVRTSSGRLGSLSETYSLLQSHLPEGGKLDSIIPSESAEVVGVLYSSQDKVGACIWNKDHLHDLGLYSADKDAKQACLGALKLVAKISSPQPPAPIASAQPQQQLDLSVFPDVQTALGTQHAGAFQPMTRAGSSTHSGTLLGINWGCVQVPQPRASCSQVVMSHQPMASCSQAVMSHQPMASCSQVAMPHQGLVDSVYLPTGAGQTHALNAWEMQASQPDPSFCCATESTTPRTLSCSGDSGEIEIMLESQKVESSRANVLHRLADMDVGEAVKLFIASQKSSQNVVG